MAKRFKKGDTVSFRFAGDIETGRIIELNKIDCLIFDGKYRYIQKLNSLTKIKCTK